VTRPIEAAEFVEAAHGSARSATVLDADIPRWLRPLAWGLMQINRLMVLIGMVALLCAALVLTSSVVSRYIMHASTDWQDETAVFCLVGAVFLCGAFVQALRGHIGIEALVGILPARINRFREIVVDLVSMLFCLFFGWKSWTLFHEAWVDGQTTSSSWGPPLSIPYGLMSVGMTLLCLQLFVQVMADGNRIVHPRLDRASEP
jgi:TRAP-type C4-dicarboxylate transport system permease small subunit